MDSLRFIGITFGVFAAAYFGLQLFPIAQPLKPSKGIQTFAERTAALNNPQNLMRENSDASDHDAVRDRLRLGVLKAGDALTATPCNASLKAAYIKAATQYARAWLSIAPCAAYTSQCSSFDNARLDLAQKAFDSPLDHRVRDTMKEVHEKGIFAIDDFPKDAVTMISLMASDPAINPQATPSFTAATLSLREPPDCAPASMQ